METTRYSDKDLEEFKVVINEKLSKATKQYDLVNSQLKEMADNNDGENTKDLTDFSTSQGEIDMLNTMASRQLKYINDLQAAIVRIRNKTYGICSVSNKLIDKRRLMAVPTTTKSLDTKISQGSIEKRTPLRLSINDSSN